MYGEREGCTIFRSGKKNHSGISALLVHLHPPLIPRTRARLTFSLCLGGLAFYFFLVLLATGILLMFYYRYGDGSPYLSVREIAEVVPYGDLMRNLHYWGGQIIVVLTLLHMVRVFVTGSYQSSKQWIWVVGALLLAMVVIMDFSGYLLRFDRETYWAGFVALGVVKAIPWIGEGLHRFLTGTSVYGAGSIQRIYLWHCVVLPITVLCFMAYHFWKVGKPGGMGRPL